LRILILLFAFFGSLFSPSDAAHSIQAPSTICSLLSGTFYTEKLGSTGLSSVGTDVFHPWERPATKVEVKFCDTRYAARVLQLANGRSLLNRVVIKQMSSGPVYDLRGVSAVRAGVDDFVILRFKSMTVSSPAPPPAGPF
jgi:hypothetical protein